MWVKYICFLSASFLLSNSIVHCPLPLMLNIHVSFLFVSYCVTGLCHDRGNASSTLSTITHKVWSRSYEGVLDDTNCLQTYAKGYWSSFHIQHHTLMRIIRTVRSSPNYMLFPGQFKRVYYSRKWAFPKQLIKYDQTENGIILCKWLPRTYR